MKQISDELWQELDDFLNRVANEREQDPNGPGSYPTYNSNEARILMKKFRIERRNPVHLC